MGVLDDLIPILISEPMVPTRSRNPSQVMLSENGIASFSLHTGERVEIDFRYPELAEKGLNQIAKMFDRKAMETKSAKDMAEKATARAAEDERRASVAERNLTAARHELHENKRIMASQRTEIEAKRAKIEELRELAERAPAPALNHTGAYEAKKAMAINEEYKDSPSIAGEDTPSLPTTEEPGALRQIGDDFAAGMAIAAKMGASKALTAATIETLETIGVPKEALEHPFLQGLIQLGTPTLLRVVAPHIPGVPKGASKALGHIQVGATASVGGDVIDAVGKRAGPIFKALKEQGAKLRELDGASGD